MVVRLYTITIDKNKSFFDLVPTRNVLTFFLFWGVKRQYLNVQLDTLLKNYKKAVLAYLRAKFDHQGLKMQIEDLSIIVIDKKLIWVTEHYFGRVLSVG